MGADVLSLHTFRSIVFLFPQSRLAFEVGIDDVLASSDSHMATTIGGFGFQHGVTY